MPRISRPAGTAALSAVILSALSCMVLSSAATINTAASIGASFDAFWSAARSQPFAEQKVIWDRVIEHPRQDLYATVVWETGNHPEWEERKDRVLRWRFMEYPRVSAQIPPAARAMQSEIPSQARRFRGLFPDAAARPLVQLVLAPNFDAKSGVLGNGTPVLLFAVDSLLLEHADMTIIFPHELFHLYHATIPDGRG